MSETLDRERIEALSTDLLHAIRANYYRGPVSRDRAFEALNALAVAVAVVLNGCDSAGADGEARAFFEKALEQQIESGPR